MQKRRSRSVRNGDRFRSRSDRRGGGLSQRAVPVKTGAQTGHKTGINISTQCEAEGRCTKRNGYLAKRESAEEMSRSQFGGDSFTQGKKSAKTKNATTRLRIGASRMRRSIKPGGFRYVEGGFKSATTLSDGDHVDFAAIWRDLTRVGETADAGDGNGSTWETEL